MSRSNILNDNDYPEGSDFRKQIAWRHRTGKAWRYIFYAATVLAIVVLAILLINVINQSFGLVAVQNEIPPSELVRDYQVERIFSADNVISGEDDQALAQGIADTDNGVGFFGYAYYAANTDKVDLLAVDGVLPTDETVQSGEYPLSRQLYLYTTAEILAEKPQVAAFVSYYLNHATAAAEQVGYFPAAVEELAVARELLTENLDQAAPELDDPGSVSGRIVATGSSTVYPLTAAVAEGFQAAGFQDDLVLASIGTGGAFNSFCIDAVETVDIINASRPISQLEREACQANHRELIEIPVATDALAVVVNANNSFATDISTEELDSLFTTAATWSEVNAEWPDAGIERFIPGSASGTLDFFIDEVFTTELEELPYETLVDILIANISNGLGRRLEREQLFFEDRTVFEDPVVFNELCAGDEPVEACFLPARDAENVYQLVVDRVVVPEVVESWYLVDSILHRSDIILEAQERYPGTEVEFRRWITPDFLSSPQSSQPELAGVRTAILGSLWVILITVAFSFPVGVGAAIYLEEYADGSKWVNQIIQTNINNLAGVPSIIYGMLGLAIFVRALEPITSGAIFGLVEDATTANGRTILSAGLTLGLLILPIIIISAQEAIRAVPNSLRRASLGLGATRWQTIWHHVLPNALPGILTGTIIAMSRAIGETAPLVVIGASTFITVDPTGPFSKFTVLPIQIFQWTTRPQGAFHNIAAAAIIALLILLLALNASAVFIRNRTTKRMA
jgi:phosphate transport system permease protein